MNIEYVKNPAPSDVDFITQQINQETVEYGEAYPFAFFRRDDDFNIIAGMVQYTLISFGSRGTTEAKGLLEA